MNGLVKTLAIALAGGALFRFVNTPLPWMIGPLLACAACNLGGADLRLPVFVRDYGQWVIGTALGLYFTPMVVMQLARLAPWILIGVAWALGLGLAFSWSIRRFAKVSRPTAFFAGTIGGASEAAVLGERAGGRVDQIAATHSLRMVLVVIVIPTVFRLLDVHGSDPYEMAARTVEPLGVLGLAAAGVSGAVLFDRLNWPNAWMLGPLVATIAITATGHHWSALPAPMVIAGQVAIGASLGSRFAPAFFAQAPRLLAVAGMTTLAGMGVTAGFAIGLATLSGIPATTLVIATAPGGIAEMALTARTLELGVPVVTAFHVVRLIATLTLTPLVYRAVCRWRRWG